MPIYEYQCNRCKSEFELLVMGSEIPACPTCQQTEVARLLSVPSSPSVKSGSLPVSSAEQGCGMPRCCGGRCES